jgi:hypothetical protein
MVVLLIVFVYAGAKHDIRSEVAWQFAEGQNEK